MASEIDGDDEFEEGVCEDSDGDEYTVSRRSRSNASSDDDVSHEEHHEARKVGVAVITAAASSVSDPGVKDYSASRGGSKKEEFERKLLSKTCFKCRGRGHLDYMCTSTSENSERCDLCRGFGHESQNCASDRSRPAATRCYSCQQTGHTIKDCRAKKEAVRSKNVGYRDHREMDRRDRGLDRDRDIGARGMDRDRDINARGMDRDRDIGARGMDRDRDIGVREDRYEPRLIQETIRSERPNRSDRDYSHDRKHRSGEGMYNHARESRHLQKEEPHYRIVDSRHVRDRSETNFYRGAGDTADLRSLRPLEMPPVQAPDLFRIRAMQLLNLLSHAAGALR